MRADSGRLTRSNNGDNMTSPTHAGSYLNKSAHKSHYENLNNSISPVNNATSFIAERNANQSNLRGGAFSSHFSTGGGGNGPNGLDSSYEARYAPAQTDSN